MYPSRLNPVLAPLDDVAFQGWHQTSTLTECVFSLISRELRSRSTETPRLIRPARKTSASLVRFGGSPDNDGATVSATPPAQSTQRPACFLCLTIVQEDECKTDLPAIDTVVQSTVSGPRLSAARQGETTVC
jgi:hypothetical protein